MLDRLVRVGSQGATKAAARQQSQECCLTFLDGDWKVAKICHALSILIGKLCTPGVQSVENSCRVIQFILLVEKTVSACSRGYQKKSDRSYLLPSYVAVSCNSNFTVPYHWYTFHVNRRELCPEESKLKITFASWNPGIRGHLMGHMLVYASA